MACGVVGGRRDLGLHEKWKGREGREVGGGERGSPNLGLRIRIQRVFDVASYVGAPDSPKPVQKTELTFKDFVS